MRRFDPDRPADICFARGTFNSHPYVMGAMHEFLDRLQDRRGHYADLDTVWNARRDDLNARLSAAGLPVQAANMTSIWTICYSRPSRYNWMLQYYMRAEGLALSWVGTGRLVFSHAYSNTDFAAVADRLVAAATAMELAGWWSGPAVTDRDIRRQITRELLRARFRRRRAAGPAASQPPVEAAVS
jgi:glutamate-1-semialdehyde 2,1-aminomutase